MQTVRIMNRVKNGATGLGSTFGDVGALEAFESIDAGLAAARELLADSPPSASTFVLRHNEERFSRTVAGWAFESPSSHQVHAMLSCVSDLVDALREKAKARIARTRH